MINRTRAVITDEQNIINYRCKQFFQAGIGTAGYSGKKNAIFFQMAYLGKVFRVQIMASVRYQSAVHIRTN